MRFYDNPPVLAEEQAVFVHDLVDYSLGKIDPTKFKAIRVAHGVYEQRQDHTYMIRIRCAAGGLTPEQLRKAAELAEAYGGGEVHFTTRQEIQVHNVTIENLMTVIEGLRSVGLSTRGGGGNTIRNILTPSHSGIRPGDVFDVDPYAMALTTRLIHEPDSWNLPRKFKIAFSTAPDDVSFTQATCLGFVAKMNGDQKGFEVYCSGGMGAKPMVGHLLLAWIPDTEVYAVTRAIKTMFDKHGNRRNRNQNRIKFLWKKIGEEEFKQLFHDEYALVQGKDPLVLPELNNEAQATDLPIETVTGQDFENWKNRYVMAQSQPGLSSILIPLKLGDIYKHHADILCDFLDHFGPNTMRCERAQNIRLRNIPDAYLGNAYRMIQQLDTLSEQPAFIGRMMNCTGAQTCKLGICLPRGLSKAIQKRLIVSDLDFDAIADFRLNMSGCPNTCGMHHIAQLGFFGKVGRKDGDLYPAYNVLAGAKVAAGQTEYAQRVTDIAAHAIPEFVYQFLRDYIAKKDQYATYNAYLDSEGFDLIKALCDQYRDVPAYADDASFYTDFGAKKRLSLEQLGTAECSAGMFDMIDVDQKTMKKIIKALPDTAEPAEALKTLLFHTSRMLLVTRGLDPKTDTEVFKLFEKHFVQTELVDKQYSAVVLLGLGSSDALVPHADAVVELANAVMALYKGMDDSLKFKLDDAAESGHTAQHVTQDFRGVACPMNFVKTKLALEALKSGDSLDVLLDDGEPIENVPNSVQQEGHTIVKKEKVENHWQVTIRKA